MTQSQLPTTPFPPQLRRRLVGILFAGQSLFSAAQIASFGVMPIVAVQLGGSDAVAGLPATVTLIGRALAAFPVGWLMDRLGRRFGLSLGFLLCTLGAALSVWAIGWVSLVGFLLGTLVAGMGRGIAEQARFAAAEVESEHNRAKAIGFIVFAGTVGAIGGPLLLAPSEQLAIRFGLQGELGPFITGGILFYLAFMLTALFLRPDPMLVGRALDAEKPKPADDAPPIAARSLRAIFADWNVRLALLSMTIGQLVMTTLMVITPLYMNRLGFGTDDVGWVLMAHTLGMFGLASVTGWIVDRTGPMRTIAAGGALLILSALLNPIATSLWMLEVALFLLGLGWNFCFVGGSALLAAALRPGERGRVQGASETLVSLASGMGSLSVGALFTQGGILGISAGGFAFSVLLLIAMGWILWLRPQPAAIAGD
jgi:MFS family permease